MDKKVELLAPAGNMECFLAAIRAGADAVYLAGQSFGARAYADNFTTEEIIYCIRHAHMYGKKVYLTVNTLVKDSEMAELVPFIQPLYEAGLDGVIVQDFGVLKVLRSRFNRLELHASTQMSVTAPSSVELLQELGVCRVVPARELSLEEIREIKNRTGIALECFIHGAMCYSYSGKCLFSAVLGGRSGNRGRCAQPCRLPYSHGDKEEYYPLSLKDMCTIDILPQLIEAGIDSFKVEGRMKAPEYVAGVISIYRKYIDLYYSHKPYVISEEDRKLLLNLYIRSEVSQGYYFQRNGRDMTTFSQPGAYKQTPDTLKDSIYNAYVAKSASSGSDKITVTFHATFMKGAEAVVAAELQTKDGQDIYVSVTGDVVSSAQKQPIAPEDIAKALRKLGDTVFLYDEESDIYLEDGCFYSLKGINELRRQLVAMLEKELILHNGFYYERIEETGLASDNKKQTVAGDNQQSISIQVTTKEQLQSFCNTVPKYQTALSMKNVSYRLVIEEALFWSKLEEIQELLCSLMSSLDTELRSRFSLLIALPEIRRTNDAVSLDALLNKLKSTESLHNIVSGFLVRNLEDLSDLQSYRERFYLQLDHCLYVWNREAANAFSSYADAFTNALELRTVEGFPEYEKIVYGHLPMMVSANCVQKTFDHCLKADDTSVFVIKDRKNIRFPVKVDCIHCLNVILNSVPLAIRDGLEHKRKKNRIIFTVEDYKTSSEVLAWYLEMILNGEEGAFPMKDYTTAFEKHGVL